MQLLEMLMHIDKYLLVLVSEYSVITYVILFFIIFLETGVVLAPFLPGDSLLFAAGALAATGLFDIWFLWLVIFVASVLGDTVNYHIGQAIGVKIFTKETSWFFRRDYLVKAQEFYEKNGKKTIILARFIPIIRTFAPFVAGIGTMSYLTFLTYNVIGAFLWSAIFIFGGYFFGNINWIKENFGLFIIIIILISIIPIIKGVISTVLASRKKTK
ncbi:hypothetical protein GW933_04220 [Candidatus Falkowbacteria bacterium]|uniref:VTT domain-containing protein n=1 Tax=Candidatus Buchananbacteria bacterium CG10_big_fil_rev_8_21_14_0_10_33_19 TaxID=1974525 RepID=A0A2H0W7A2_9BACT|nr:hypothetical protein [Candidatus Falkowbacteria bacterium]PIS06500.1 MAG: hypothetical protein COT80_00775 [Candidatus Buchananbacteria bacterium CG10_big_fil_rev_8_21_14_0_10_33_19]